MNKNYNLIKENAKNEEIFSAATEVLEIFIKQNFTVEVMYIFECFAFSFGKNGKFGSFCISVKDKKCVFIWMNRNGFCYSFSKKFKYDKDIFVKCLGQM